MNIAEGIMSMWSYHIRRDEQTRALCGALVMGTAMTLDQWGKPFGEHFPKHPTWCHTCDKLRRKA